MSLKKLKSAIFLTCGGVAAYISINLFKYNDKFYEEYVMPAVHTLDPETAHRLGIFISKYRLLPKSPYIDPDLLKIDLFGHKVSNPIGIAAGFDKHGEAIKGLFDLGFGLVEVGSVTPLPQPGNDKPRLFRLKEDMAVVNRYGFNSDGHESVFNRLQKLSLETPHDKQGLVGINLGKNKTSQNASEDYVMGINKFAPVADYLVVNISSPNTPGLRNLQNEKELTELLENVTDARDNLEKKVPILLKLAPDLSSTERENIANIAMRYKIDGLIISNTSVARPETMVSEFKNEVGGLSGVPIKDGATQMIAEMYKYTNGRIPIIGVGGISSGIDAYEKIKAGASALQIYTSLVYGGPPVIIKIKSELAALLQRDGYKSIKDAVGSRSQNYALS